MGPPLPGPIRRPVPRRLHVLIAGGGASGALMAAHLLTRGHGLFRITLVERDGPVGAGIAYATREAEHLARIDPLRIGLEVAQDCRLIDARGQSSRHIFAIGPVSRAAFWEITAIPDIREQTARLAEDLVAALAAAAEQDLGRHARP